MFCLLFDAGVLPEVHCGVAVLVMALYLSDGLLSDSLLTSSIDAGVLPEVQRGGLAVLVAAHARLLQAIEAPAQTLPTAPSLEALQEAQQVWFAG